jgi:predicted lipid-binding transport protein (Tim44 family)
VPGTCLAPWTRILIGLVGGLMRYLILAQPLGHAVVNQAFFQDWRAVAVVGFVGGFAERLVATVFQRTAAGLQDSSGTPVQAVRRSDGHRPALS